MITCGIDEAGRGPVIGPMVIGCAVLDEKGRNELRRLNVRDSKKVAASRRILLEPKIKEIALEWKLIKIPPAEIDMLRKKFSLNVIETMKIAKLILSLENIPDKVIVDAADRVEEEFTEKIVGYMRDADPKCCIPDIISEHMADDNYIEVGAASILAKVERDRNIEQLVEEYGNFGSGYPADEITKNYIRAIVRKGTLPDIVRRSWNTLDKAKQTRLEEF